MDCSVIIPCWIIDVSLLKLTERCIGSIRETYPDVELIIVDNGSPLGQGFMMEHADIYIRNQSNRGYVKAINQGIKLSSKEWIVIGNNDVMVRDGWLDELKKVFKNTKDCGASVPHFDHDPMQGELWEERLVGSWFLINRDIINKIGLFDEQFFNRFSDLDYAWRMKKHKLKIYATSYTTAMHNCQASLDKIPHDTEREEFKDGSRLLIEKWRKDPDMGKAIKEVLG